MVVLLDQQIPLLILVLAVVVSSYQVTFPSASLAEPTAATRDMSSQQGNHFTRLPTAECKQLQEALIPTLGVKVTRTTSPFLDYVSRKRGTGCLLTAIGTGREFSSPAEVLRKVGKMLTKKGWVEKTAYAAGGPTGMSAGFLQSNQLGISRLEWQPAPGVKCPSAQPIASCTLAPKQKRYTITLNLAQLLPVSSRE